MSRPENIMLVRAAVTGFAVAHGLDDGFTNALKTAASEAANNIAIHAYEGAPGPMSLTIGTCNEGLQLLVQDKGRGFSQISPNQERIGLGIPVINALADSAEFTSRAAGGTDVRMRFKHQLRSVDELGAHLADMATPMFADSEISGVVADPQLFEQVIGRLCRAVAAQCRFNVEQINQLRVAFRGLSAQLEDAPVQFAVHAAPRRLELALGHVREPKLNLDGFVKVKPGTDSVRLEFSAS